MQFFSMKSADNIPFHHFATTDLWLSDDNKRRDVFQVMLNELVQLYINIDITFTNKPQKTIDNITDDGVQTICNEPLAVIWTTLF